MLSRVARPLWLAALLPAWIAILSMGSLAAEPAPPVLKIGMIGLDTSHCLEFTKLINADPPDPELSGCRVVAVHPKGSPDIASSVRRVPEYTVKIKAMGVEVVDDLPAMLARVDVVLLETNDGRPHLAQATAVIEA
ncbi:MAG: gfo/Idh/MocA family oxidoreductase, partial [Planctomycetia bacterium]